MCVVASLLCATGASVRADDVRADRRLVPSDPSPRWTLVGDQRLGAGFDANPTLSPDPDLRRDQGGPEVGPSALAASETDLTALVGDAWWAGAQAGLDARLYLDPEATPVNEQRLQSALRGFGGWNGSAFAALLALEGGRYDASFAADDSWSGRTTLRGELRLAEAWRFGAQGAAGLRRYDAGGQLDRSWGGGLDVGWRDIHCRLMMLVQVDRRESDDPLAVRTEVVPGLLATARAGAFEVDARYFLLARVFDVPDRDGLEHVGRLEGAYWLGRLFAPFLRIDGGIARGEGAALDYERWAVLAGLRARLELPARREPPPPRTVPRRQGGATLLPEGVRFRYRVPHVRAVSVVATFNGWDAEAGRLHALGDGVFEAVFSVAPGRHRYQLLVDGEPVRPPQAAAYVPDDFGGEDAVLIVPSAR